MKLGCQCRRVKFLTSRRLLPSSNQDTGLHLHVGMQDIVQCAPSPTIIQQCTEHKVCIAVSWYLAGPGVVTPLENSDQSTSQISRSQLIAGRGDVGTPQSLVRGRWSPRCGRPWPWSWSRRPRCPASGRTSPASAARPSWSASSPAPWRTTRGSTSKIASIISLSDNSN